MSENLLVNKTDLQAFNLSGTYSHRTGKRSPSCNMPENQQYMTEQWQSFFGEQKKVQ